jgi:hypothetical protein
MKQKKLILTIVGVSVALLLLVLINLYSLFNTYGMHLIGNTNRSIVYESKNGAYSMRFPGGWHENEIKTPISSDPKLITIFSTFRIRTFVNVHKINDPKLSLMELVKMQKENISKLESPQYLGESKKILGFNTGTLLEFVYFRESFRAYYLNHCYSWIIPENGGYAFLFCAENSKWNYANPIFMNMMKSIELIKSSS